jgi:hypothetical protein
VRVNIPRGHPAGVKRQYHVIDLADAPLPFRHDLRLELGLSVPRHRKPHRTRRRGNRLPEGAVPGIPGSVSRRVAFHVTQVIVHFRAQRPLDNPGRQLADQPARPVQQRNAGVLRVGDHPVDRRVADEIRQPFRRGFLSGEHHFLQALARHALGDDCLHLFGLFRAHSECPLRQRNTRHTGITCPRLHRRLNRLGILADWKGGPHLLTYRQAGRTSGLVADLRAKDEPDGLPSAALQAACDDLLEASIPAEHKNASTALAVDWTDMETFSRPPPKGTRDCADPEASWGHRKDSRLHRDDELFYGYYFSAGIMMPDEHGRPVPEYARRITLSSCRQDPVPAFVPVLTALPAAGVPPGDVLADSGYAYRVPANWAVPLRAAGASLVQDLHPSDRGPHGTHHGAIISNGRLYCLQAPRPLLQLGPLARDATREDIAAHDTRTAELARYKLGKITAEDADGYHRVMCPAVMGKIRCPFRPASMTLDRDRPEILTPPQDPPACCTQQTLTVPPDIVAKTAQKHDYPSREHRRSYARRTGAERVFATLKDPATNDITRGWCRLMGLAPRMLFTTCLTITRNQRITAAWDRRQEAGARRAAAGLPPRTRRRRRKTPASLVTAPP